MKIETLKLKGYRSYTGEVTVQLSPITILVGPNGVGKSSVLEALDLFFNKNGYSQDDVCKEVLQPFEITVVLSGLPAGPESLDLDEGRRTSFDDEPYFLNQDGKLEIKKVYKNTGKMSVNSSLVCYLPSDEMAKIIGEKDEKLKKRIEDLGIADQCQDMRVNALMRRTLFDYYSANSPAWAERIVSTGDREAGFERILPQYSLFKVDRLNNAKDTEVAEPVKYAVQAAIKEAQTEVDAATTKVKEKIQIILDKANGQLAANFGDDMPKFSVDVEPDMAKAFPTNLIDAKQLDFGKQGSGISRLYMLNLMLSEAERKKSESGRSSIIFAIEEPETSQHPDFQERLIATLHELAEKQQQVILTTHNPYLLSRFDKSAIRVVSPQDPRIVDCSEPGTLKAVVKALGMLPDPLPNAKFRAILVVEGPSDIDAIEQIRLRHTGLNEALKDVWVVPGGGNTIRDWVRAEHFCERNVPQFFLVDNDFTPTGGRGETYNNLVAAIRAFRREDLQKILPMRRSEIEQYAHGEAIKRCLGNQGISTDGLDAIIVQLNENTIRPETVFHGIHNLRASTIRFSSPPENWLTIGAQLGNGIFRGHSFAGENYKKLVAQVIFSEMQAEEFLERFGYTSDDGQPKCELDDWVTIITDTLVQFS